MLPQVKTILFACDLEDKTQESLSLVMSIAASQKAKIIFMHAIEPMNHQAQSMINNYLPIEELQSLRREALNSVKDAMETQITIFYENHANNNELPEKPEYLIIQEDASSAIKHAVEDHKVDLVVMNSRTHSKIGQMIIGSTANKVIHQSQVPVMVIPLR
ncbi:universal stress protein [Marinomonas sp. SBI22]|uniref:universal stress protein n=1 Tax=unclassified Marinomonas TaxID=196814 RepID=UPI0007AEEA39|nr:MULTISPECIES: universal stress protein [unclassified Marinomonas]KZM40091.1 universal stress protein [Marinomonas sp. SBI22]KZM41385.1 universal stress protein [Marinomonas sp. SBI8L]